MDNIFDLRSLEFRNFILHNYHYHNHHLKLSVKSRMDLVSILIKNNVSNKDLIHLYLILGNVLDIFLFDYKMSIISVEEIDKFLEIVKEETGRIIGRYFDIGGVVTYDALSYFLSIDKLDKLVKIFLYEV